MELDGRLMDEALQGRQMADSHCDEVSAGAVTHQVGFSSERCNPTQISLEGATRVLAQSQFDAIVTEIRDPELAEGVLQQYMAVTAVNGDDMRGVPCEAVSELISDRQTELEFVALDGHTVCMCHMAWTTSIQLTSRASVIHSLELLMLPDSLNQEGAQPAQKAEGD